jgi:DNA-binding LacI/PurR family transcriptional regulator
MESLPTIRTLARMAGVSNATVSLALRNHPRIGREVRERVQRLAAEVGYKSNPVVANLLVQLRSRKTASYQSTLGFLQLGGAPGDLSSNSVPTFRNWNLGCHERSDMLGYTIDYFAPLQSKLSAEHLIRILDARAIRGLLVMGLLENSALPSEFAPVWQRYASIAIGQRPIHPSLSYVANDQFSSASQAVRELVQLGYRRPGLCVHPLIDERVENRFSGGFSVEQHRLHGKALVPVFDFQPARIDPGVERRFQSWVNRYRPDVILTLHLEIEPWLKEMGLAIPADIGLVHLDKFQGLDWAGMDQNSTSVGRAAVDMVIGQLHRNEFGPPPFQKSMLIASTWVSGPTIRRLAAPELQSSRPARAQRPVTAAKALPSLGK